jgi:hypothetical protein
MSVAHKGAVFGRIKALAARTESGITAYDLFAAGVAAMALGRLASTFDIDSDALKLPLRILLPVFMIPIGYNVGRRVEWRIVACALSIILARWLLFNEWYSPPLGNFPVNFLVTIIVTRIFIEPLMALALKTRVHFWLASLALVALAPPLHSHVAEYGTLGTLMAMCGWLARNREEAQKIVDVRDFFILVCFYYLAFNQSLYQFGPLSFAVMAGGTAWVFRLCYNFRALLLNSIRRRPADPVAKISHFMGRNSLELYTLFVLVSYGLFYYGITTTAAP